MMKLLMLFTRTMPFEVKVKMNLVTNTENSTYTLLEVNSNDNSETNENGEDN